MTWHCLAFEVNSIQRWIFGSGKLRAIAGGSKLVSGITDELLEATLEALPVEVEDQLAFARQAGGVFIALSENEQAVAVLRRTWPLLVSRYAPGLSFSMGYAQAETVKAAMDNARADIGASGALPQPNLPLATPVMERSRRTGRSAVRRSRNDDEPVDAVTAAQLDAEERSRDSQGSPDIGARLARALKLDRDPWPRDMEPTQNESDHSFPFLRDEKDEIVNRYVALVHADGNGLGQLLQKLELGDGRQRIERHLDFSEALNNATEAACVHACRQVLLPEITEDGRLPARPILLGGDDLSFIVRADLALHFTQVFLDAFERETQGIDGVPNEGLTACAGLAYLRSNQPFYMGMELAEALCSHAKKQVREYTGPSGPMFSALCQHRSTDSLISDWEALLEHSLTLPARADDAKAFRLTMETWSLRQANPYGFPPIKALFDLLDFFEEPVISRGPARKLLGLIGLQSKLVAQKYSRWLEMLAKADLSRSLDERFLDLLQVGVDAERLADGPFIDWETHWATPIPEALALKAMGVKAQIPSTGNEEKAA